MKRNRTTYLIRGIAMLWITLCTATALAQDAETVGNRAKLEKKLNEFFSSYKPEGVKLDKTPKMVGYTVNDATGQLVVTADETFAQQEFSPKIVKKIYKKIKNAVPKPYNDYNIQVKANGLTLEELIPNRLTENTDEGRLWGKTEYEGKPWVENVSRPQEITQGLQNRHLSVWASHGRYYDQSKSVWRWQRPNLFGTTEDLYTQTIVYPYLIPMLENAGAVVFSPRERDWQKNEVIVDNDDGNTLYYKETSRDQKWQTTGTAGFARHAGLYADQENPFTSGTARMASTTSNKKSFSSIAYQPDIQKEGRYAVYVSYQTVAKSIDDAQYIVYHRGQPTIFHVNQTMGSGTWVYLGTFDFAAGRPEENCVVITNLSRHNGVVTSDAVRFGGGMGNIARGGTSSQLPRSLEGARYYAQWAGAPAKVVSMSNGSNDYNDDINVRSLMTNWLAGGSCFVPQTSGLHVPIEMALAVHSDAGVNREGGIVGSLAICTTNNDGKTSFGSGLSRMASRDLADALLAGVYRDVCYKYKTWTRRSLYDKNYSETRRPEMPSAILETLSHQNFHDMCYGLDPNFRFTLARSIYKTILRYVADQHGQSFAVTPLQPTHFRIEFSSKNKVTLKWSAVTDPQEPTAKATSFNVYTATGKGGFDNGVAVHSTSHTMELTPGVLYRFKVTACNRGGESFPTEELVAVCQPGSKKTVLIVNGFHRLASPAVVNTDTQQGFNIDQDPGVTFGPTAGWSGRQTCYDKSQMGKEGPGALGYCGNELTGQFIAGNSFNYATVHAEAMLSAQAYNIVSCSTDAVEEGKVNILPYACVDLILGLEKDDGYSLYYYKTFKPAMQQKLTAYIKKKGNLLVSGSYIGTDMAAPAEQQFLAEVLKVTHAGNQRYNASNKVEGLNMNFGYYHGLNEEHYAATSPDVLQALRPAYCAMRYDDGRGAAVAYDGKDCRTFTLGFPFECITDAATRASLMRGIMAFLVR